MPFDDSLQGKTASSFGFTEVEKGKISHVESVLCSGFKVALQEVERNCRRVTIKMSLIPEWSGLSSFPPQTQSSFAALLDELKSQVRFIF